MIEKVIERVNSNPWFIVSEESIHSMVARSKSFDEMAKNTNPYKAALYASENGRYEYDVINGFAIIDINGETQKTTDIFDEAFGLRSTEKVMVTISAALSDLTVSRILLNIDSPGGTVDGTKELSDFIFDARGQKPIIAYTNGMMTSAAYYIGSAADAVVAAPNSSIGSIGVISIHMDASKWYEDMGLKMSVIRAGKFKAIGNQFEELTPESRAVLQERIDKMYSVFVSDVARNRGVDFDTAKADMADARVFFSDEALNNGLLDAVGYFDKSTGQFKAIQTNSKKGVSMNLFGDSVEKASAEQLKEKNPTVYGQVFEAGKESGKAESSEQNAAAVEAAKQSGIEEGKSAGIAEEQARAKAIFETASEEQIKLAASLVVAGKSVEEAKDELLKDAQATRAAALEAFRAGAASDIDHSSEGQKDDITILANSFDTDSKLSEAYANKGGKDAFLKALGKWGQDEKVRADFGGNVQAFLAFERNTNK
ncbi:MAG: signal peptide peptidase SppA [Porphyromonadaceae bacterium]|nr:signal peptide peptidase SppA [Porphyromonadaceae bacterium]